MPRSAAPFYQLSDNVVEATDWLCELNGGPPQVLGSILPDWDYQAQLRLSRTVRINWSKVMADLGLASVPALDLVVEVGSGRGNLPRETPLISRWNIPVESGDLRIRIDLDSGLLSHQLVLRSTVILAATPTPLGGPLSPITPGSRLWSERVKSTLEGDDPRFPMEVVSFARFFGARSVGAAPWYLNWSPSSVGRDFRGSLRLYLNGDDAEFIRRVQEQDALTLQAIMADVVSQVTEALLSDALLSAQLDEAEDETLGSEAVYWLVRAFGSVDMARSILEQRPGEFRASVLASVRLT